MKNNSNIQQFHTISAVCTAMGEGAIGIIRISGENALKIGEAIFKSASNKEISAYPRNTLIYGYVYDFDNTLVDEAMAVYMKAPYSYTAEDVVEIQCHGGVRSLQKILTLTYEAGAVPAEPGEFTKRAFLNGRIDLIQAEAVMDIIKSRSEKALKMAVKQQQGALSNEIKVLRKSLLDIIVNLEAVIDYPEDDIEDVTYGRVEEVLSETKEKIGIVLKNAHTGKIVREGLKVAIVGKPNVGKSSLLNYLLKEDRAIVSEYAGTTRDVIEEHFLLDGIPLVFADTAGIRETDNFVEQIGVQKSKHLISEAELIIAVLDGSKEITPEDEEILESIINKSYVIILNKADLEFKIDVNNLEEKFGKDNIIKLSAKGQFGLQELNDWIKNFVYGDEKNLEGGIYVQNSRHENLLKQALSSIEDALMASVSQLPYDCIVIDLRNATDAMGEITGETVKDEIINEIFAKFCVGK